MPAVSFTSCPAIDQRLLQQSGLIGPDTYERGRGQSLWLTGIVPQKAWRNHMGQTIKNTVYERSGLTSPPTWEDVNNSDGASVNACIPPLVIISNAISTQEYRRAHIALESDPLCLEDIRDSHEPRKALASFSENLMDNANYVRLERVRSEYERLSNHKVIVAPGLPEDDAAFPLVEPTSPMTMGVLRRKFRQLQRETANLKPVATNSRGAQNFIFVASGETIENMIKNDDKVRDDFRWSDRVSELLGAYDQKFSYGGFVFMEDPFPPRVNFYGGAFHRVPEYTSSEATQGNKLEISAAYENAEFEKSYIVHPDVMTSRVPDPNIELGGGVTYGARNYALEFRWVNEYDRNCNPDRNIGFMRAVGMHASEPIHRNLGYVFLSLRCDAELGLVACPEGSGYNS